MTFLSLIFAKQFMGSACLDKEKNTRPRRGGGGRGRPGAAQPRVSLVVTASAWAAAGFAASSVAGSGADHGRRNAGRSGGFRQTPVGGDDQRPEI